MVDGAFESLGHVLSETNKKKNWRAFEISEIFSPKAKFERCDFIGRNFQNPIKKKRTFFQQTDNFPIKFTSFYIIYVTPI